MVPYPTTNTMAQVQRRNTDIGDNVREKQERRKSGIFSFTRSFKKYASSFGYFFFFSSPVVMIFLGLPYCLFCQIPNPSSNGNMHSAKLAIAHVELDRLPRLGMHHLHHKVEGGTETLAPTWLLWFSAMIMERSLALLCGLSEGDPTFQRSKHSHTDAVSPCL